MATAILVDVTFNGSMDVTGTPAIELDVGGSAKSAPYVSGTGLAVLTFGYDVVADDVDTDGVSIDANKLSLNGGTISAADTSVPLGASHLTHLSVADDAGHQVDGVRPTVTAASVDGSTLTLTWSEPLNVNSLPPDTAFALTLGTGAASVSTVAVDGSTMTLTLSAAVAASVSVTLDYTPGTTPIKDLPGNDAVTFTQTVMNETSANMPPVFAPTSVTIEVPEDTEVGTAIGAALTATDEDLSDTLTYTLGGPDQGFFQLNASTELVLTVALNFEAPADAGTDNGYEVTVTANDGTASAVLSVTVNVTDVPDVAPGKPGNLVAVADGPNAVNLSWTVPADAGDSDITGYRIEVSTDGNNWMDVTADTGSADLSYQHTGRMPGTRYDYRVSAINMAGPGLASDAADAKTELHEVSIVAVRASVTEGEDAVAVFSLTRNGTPVTELLVDVVLSPVGDFIPVGIDVVLTSVRFGASDTTTTFDVAIVDDSVKEADGSVNVSISTADGRYTASNTERGATVAIVNDDEPNFSLSAAAQQIAEGTSTELTVSTGDVSFEDAQAISLTFVGTASSTDYMVTDGTGAPLSDPYELTLATGATSVTATITATDDLFVEAAETIEITGRHDGATFSTTVTIPANDTPTFRLVVSPDTTIEEDDDDLTSEDERIATFVVEVEGGRFETDHEITLSVGGSATEDVDYTVSTTTLTIAAGQTTSDAATITTLPDNVNEAEETIEFSHNGTAFTTTVTIPANDTPDYTPVVSPETITEGGSASVRVETGGVTFATPQEIMITLSSTDGAREDVDYTVSTTTLTIPVGATTSDAAMIRAVDGNRVVEDDENITITFSHSIGSRNLEITDNDVPSFNAVSGVAAVRAIKEGGGTNRPESALFVVTTGNVDVRAERDAHPRFYRPGR